MAFNIPLPWLLHSPEKCTRLQKGSATEAEVTALEVYQPSGGGIPTLSVLAPVRLLQEDGLKWIVVCNPKTWVEMRWSGECFGPALPQ